MQQKSPEDPFEIGRLNIIHYMDISPPKLNIKFKPEFKKYTSKSFFFK